MLRPCVPRNITRALFLVLAGFSVTACHEIDAPFSRSVRPPLTVARSTGAPDPITYFLASDPGKTVELTYYPYDTWVVITPSPSQL
jgi:hypothetical protein